jgi:hypothetical protein
VRSLAVALLLGLCLAAAGCGGGSKAITVSGHYRYPTRVIDSFMRTCTHGKPARNSLCACVIDKLSYSVSNRDFARVLVGREVARVKRATRRAAAACA